MRHSPPPHPSHPCDNALKALIVLAVLLVLLVLVVLAVAIATRATAHNQLVPWQRRRGCIFIMKRVNLHENENENENDVCSQLSSQWSISVARPLQIYAQLATTLRHGLSVFYGQALTFFYGRCILSLELRFCIHVAAVGAGLLFTANNQNALHIIKRIFMLCIIKHHNLALR